MAMPSVTLTAESAEQLASALLTTWGANASAAAQVAEHLVGADLCGHASHGMSRLPWYRRYVDEGTVRPSAIPTIESDDPLRDGIATVSANWGFGQPAGNLAIELAVKRAHDLGVGAVAVVRTTHMGRIGAYVEHAAEQGCVAMATVGGMRGAGVTVPFGGVEPLLGPSPIAMAFPAQPDAPVLMDISTTEVPLGKIMIAKASGRRLPVPGLVEPDGTLTDDPTALDRGAALATFGGHKGFALATMAELLGGSLTGAFAYQDEGAGGPAFRGSGMLVVTIAVDAFGATDLITGAATSVQHQIRAVPPASGVTCVMAPGDPEVSRRRSSQGRIAVPESLWQQIVELASASDVAVPETEWVNT